MTLDAALLALLAHRPLAEITIREITAEAGCGYATFFRHYPDKAALLANIAEAEVASVFQRFAPMVFGVGGAQAARALCQYVAERRALWRALLTGGAAGQVRQAFLDQARQAAGSLPRGLIGRDGAPPELAIGVGVAGALEVLDWWLAHGGDMPAETAAAYLERLVVSPILQDRA